MGLKTLTIDFTKFTQEPLVRSNYKTAILGIEIKKQIQKSKNKFVRLKEHLDITSGFAFKSADYKKEGLPLIRIGNVGNDFDENNMVFLPEGYKDNYSRFLLKKNDIIVSLTGDGKLKSDLILENNKYLLNQRVGSLKAKENTNILFFFYLLCYFSFTKKQFYWWSNGKTQLNISPFDFLKIKIPLIPKSKQNQIVSQIKPIEKKIKKLKTQIISPQEVFNKIFAKEFKFDLKEISNIEKIKYFSVSNNITYRNFNLRSSVRWNKIKPIQKVLYKNNPYIEKLSKYILSTRNGWSPNCRETDTKNCVFGVNSISKNGYIKFEDLKFSNENKTNITEYYAKENDLFVSRGNTVDLVALASIIKNLPKETNFIFPDLFIRIELNTKQLNKEYFTFLFNSIIGRYYFKYSAKGKNQTMVKISSDELNNFYLPTPPLILQQKIVNKIKSELNKQEKIKKQIKAKRNKIDEIIKTSIN